MGDQPLIYYISRVNHILRVTKPNTKRATNICPNSLSQIGACSLRFNWRGATLFAAFWCLQLLDV
jgi:hypothetical protein